MLREKYNTLSNKRGYLYLRETIYKRDRRTLKRKPSKLCDGSATKERGKYSIKIDTYCGKIFEKELKYIETFNDYILKKHTNLNKNNLDFDYLKYKLTSSFDKLLDDFIEYLFYIYEIDKNIFYNKKKITYAINNGYLSKETIFWLRKFRINGNYQNKKEIKRFTYRCNDIGIYDEEIIQTLYLKLVPEDLAKEKSLKDFKKELDLYKSNEFSNKLQIKKMRDFIKESMK